MFMQQNTYVLIERSELNNNFNTVLNIVCKYDVDEISYA